MKETVQLQYLTRVHQVHDELIKRCNRNFSWIVAMSMLVILISTKAVEIQNQISFDSLNLTIGLNKLIICLSLAIAYIHQGLMHKQAKAAKSYSWLLELYKEYNMIPRTNESNGIMMQFVLPYFFYESHTHNRAYDSKNRLNKIFLAINNWGFRLVFNWLPLLAIIAGAFKLNLNMDSSVEIGKLIGMCIVALYELINVLIWLFRDREMNLIHFLKAKNKFP